MPENSPLQQQAPASYVNWHYAQAGRPSREAIEVPFYTDAQITGEIRGELGPYELINPVVFGSGHGVERPAIVLRTEIHVPELEPPRMDRTDTSTYHGGLLEDEIAALLSLCLGIRAKAGPVSRVFAHGGDPRGHPVAYDPRPTPFFMTNILAPMLPWAIGSHSLNEGASLFATLPSLTAEDASALVKAARTYQNAVWIAESEPELTWLFLVSVIETVASHWISVEETPEQILRDARPDLASELEQMGAEVLESVANRLSRMIGAFYKFRRFLVEFLPDVPQNRPPAGFQHEWSPEVIGRSLRRIYNHRSDALHGGTPFPAPMCMPPHREARWSAPSEIPLGLAAHVSGGTWVREDYPIFLHIFEYLVRGAVLRWWTSLLRPGTDNAARIAP